MTLVASAVLPNCLNFEALGKERSKLEGKFLCSEEKRRQSNKKMNHLLGKKAGQFWFVLVVEAE